jgi:transposase
MVPLNDWLRLPGVNVERYVDQGEHIVLQVTQSNPSIFCPSWGQFLERINQICTCLMRDLSISGRRIYLQIPRRQFYCVDCHRYSTENLEFADEERSYTR